MDLLATPTSDESTQVQREDCTHWTSSIYQYELSAALKAGFAVGSVETKGNYRLLVMEVARSATVTNGDRTERWGYGYRLLVEVDDAQAVGTLTLPAIAATAELSKVEASVRLDVHGFKGEGMWSRLPVPKPLDVDTHKEFLEAAARVQKAFAEDVDGAVPVKLAEGPTESVAAGGITRVEGSEAVGIVLMLNLAEGGDTQATAAKTLASQSDLDAAHVDQLAQALYLMLDKDGDRNRRAEIAGALLQPLKKTGWKLP